MGPHQQPLDNISSGILGKDLQLIQCHTDACKFEHALLNILSTGVHCSETLLSKHIDLLFEPRCNIRRDVDDCIQHQPEVDHPGVLSIFQLIKCLVGLNFQFSLTQIMTEIQ